MVPWPESFDSACALEPQTHTKRPPTMRIYGGELSGCKDSPTGGDDNSAVRICPGICRLARYSPCPAHVSSLIGRRADSRPPPRTSMLQSVARQPRQHVPRAPRLQGPSSPPRPASMRRPPAFSAHAHGGWWLPAHVMVRGQGNHGVYVLYPKAQLVRIPSRANLSASKQPTSVPI